VNELGEVNKFRTYATREEFPAPIGRLLGLTLIRDGVGRATVEFQAGTRHANPMGTFMVECFAISQMRRWAWLTAPLLHTARHIPPSN
jgi:hypothetical protein